MPSLADLHRAVRNTLRSERLGTPVFVRYHLECTCPPDELLPRLATAAAEVRDWLDRPVGRIVAVGSAATRSIAVLVQLQQGATALVSCSPARQAARLDLTVLGNHGAIYHDLNSGPLDETGLRADPELLGAIERAVRSGKPQAFAEVGP